MTLAKPVCVRKFSRVIVMSKKFLVAWAATFLAWMVGSIVVHGLLLHRDYAQLPNLFRPEEEAQKLMPIMILAHVIMSGAYVRICVRGLSAGSWLLQGLQFGATVSLLTVVPTYMIYYVVQPMPGWHVFKQILFDGSLIVLLGAVPAFVYRQSINTSR